jgi:hypothetical protein
MAPPKENSKPKCWTKMGALSMPLPCIGRNKTSTTGIRTIPHSAIDAKIASQENKNFIAVAKKFRAIW